MTDLIIRPEGRPVPERSPESRPDQPIKHDTRQPLENTLAEQLITTQAPQRP
jgi:hypothetical protein